MTPEQDAGDENILDRSNPYSSLSAQSNNVSGMRISGKSVRLTNNLQIQRPPSLNILPATDVPPVSDVDIPRSTSVTSSLDPYYFTTLSHDNSPVNLSGGTSPEREFILRDRDGLVGLGELQTPRWTKAPNFLKDIHNDIDDISFTERHPNRGSVDDRDSPWTIEAVDGELEDSVSPSVAEGARIPLISKSISHHSLADESGGEEILYPRKAILINISEELPVSPGTTSFARVESPSTPSSVLSPARKAKKRSSDEFAFDQSGYSLSKVPLSPMQIKHEKHEKPSLRKHHSIALGTSSVPAQARERRRGGSVRVSTNSNVSSANSHARAGRHARQHSINASVSSQAGPTHLKAPNDSDSQSAKDAPVFTNTRTSNCISAHFTDPVSEKVFVAKDKEPYPSPSVAHSLLRGMQEGWPGLDDETTAEALRKLDGISGKSARVRGSTGFYSRASNHSRATSPGSRGHRSDDTEPLEKTWFVSEGASNISSNCRKESEKPELPALNKASTESIVQPKANSNTGPSDIKQRFTERSEVPGSKPHSSINGRSNLSANYSSVPSTTGISASNSRESTLSIVTASATSAPVTPNRLFLRAKRNSTGSDVSSANSYETHKDKLLVTSAIGSDDPEIDSVPPVPPLPKDLSTYKTPPQSSTSAVFAPSESSLRVDEQDRGQIGLYIESENQQRNQSLDSKSMREAQERRSVTEMPVQAVTKSPTKKWSFTNPLNLRRSTSPSRREAQSTGSTGSGSRSSFTGKHLRPSSSSKDSPLRTNLSPKSSIEAWQTIREGAMNSETSLVSFSSLSSLPEPSPPLSPAQDNLAQGLNGRIVSRDGTVSSAGANHTISSDQILARESPPSKPPSDLVSKRLTPSSIPFFRRSSSHSMYMAPSQSGLTMPASPTFSSDIHPSNSVTNVSPQDPSMSTSVPSFSQRKSMLSLGFPSLLKGSGSKKNLQLDKNPITTRATDRLRKSKESNENLRAAKDDKDRSESRISVLMGRKRGKTLSSTDQKKVKPATLPPMQVSALPPHTNERLSKLKASPSTPPQSTSPRTHVSSTRATSQTISSLQKQSDSSLRSSRQQLPTIAGSPSVGIQSLNNRQSQALQNSMAGLQKEAPTRIPRIASRSSTVGSPQLKNTPAVPASRRKSLNTSTGEYHSDNADVGGSLEEFGVLDRIDSSQMQTNAYQRHATRVSPIGSSKLSRQHSGFSAALSASGIVSRKAVHDISTAKGLRKSSIGSISSMSNANNDATHPNSSLSPSKGFNKLLSPKMSLPGSRLSSSSTVPNILQRQVNSPSTRRPSLSTPSPMPSPVDEDELLGDEEMMQYIRRTHSRKLAHGAKKEDLDEMLKFPEPLPPGRPLSPEAVLGGDKSAQLSDYERKEILDYPDIFFVSDKNHKKMVSKDVSANNFGYDDERGDYQIINRDHLAYRYEIMDTLGKGSFGQVLHCRDHCTGESVAIKIIRNKNRFYHQALMEIKILDNLRKWDPEEKHHVIKMNEHFYFRNHLCIAMELLSINLYELIKANGFAGFSTTLIRRFTSQMLLSLSLMRHHRIVHCDLKPENVLLRHPTKSAIKVIDFGSSCLEHEKVYTYIQSRFYRSPEVILGMNYNMAIDMWSLGCILAELYTGYPIFPGENEQEQLSCIMEVLGTPDKDLINRSKRKKVFFDSTGTPRPVVNSKGRRRRAGTKSLAQVLRCDDELFIDFVSKCLSWDPERRLKPQSALRHPFITAGKKAKILNNTSPPSSRERNHMSTSSLLGVGKTKAVETPKKSQISAPTPLAARSVRTSAVQLPSTPLGALTHVMQSPAKNYRSPQSGYQSSRSMNGFVVTAAK